MCYNSPAIQKEISRIISQVVGPALEREINKLKQEHREYLFAGITVGSEAGFDDYSMDSELYSKSDPAATAIRCKCRLRRCSGRLQS